MTSRADELKAAFSEYRNELDAQHDQRERIVKLSRDITALSKKLIFTLHRVNSSSLAAVLKDSAAQLEKLRGLFSQLGPEVQGNDFYKYERSISPGIQEYVSESGFAGVYRQLTYNEQVEGYLLHQYLSTSKVPALEQVQESLPNVHLTISDYLGGLADLTGELMRLCIASSGSALNAAKEIEGRSLHELSASVREIKGEMNPLVPLIRGLQKKMEVLDQSLTKMENATYALRIRTSEQTAVTA